jgi:hypothetical protein
LHVGLIPRTTPIFRPFNQNHSRSKILTTSCLAPGPSLLRAP